jgi:hypothetical protein
VHYTTTFRWRHRFLENHNEIIADELSGVAETENYKMKKSYKGSKTVRPIVSETETVDLLFSRDRHRFTFDKIFEELDINNLSKEMKTKIKKDVLFCSDSKQIYFDFIKECKFRHGFVDIQNGQYVKKDIVHLNNVQTYYVDLKDWMIRFRGVATKYLHNYLSWYRGLDEYNNEMPPEVMLLRAKSSSEILYQPKLLTKPKSLVNPNSF